VYLCAGSVDQTLDFSSRRIFQLPANSAIQKNQPEFLAAKEQQTLGAQFHK
jgi:hypothetical protein